MQGGSYYIASRKEVTDTTHTGCCENRLLGDMVECRKTRQEAVAIIQEVGDEWWYLGLAGRTDRLI